MFRKALWILLLVGCVAMVWHGVTGDTGASGRGFDDGARATDAPNEMTRSGA